MFMDSPPHAPDSPNSPPPPPSDPPSNPEPLPPAKWYESRRELTDLAHRLYVMREIFAAKQQYQEACWCRDLAIEFEDMALIIGVNGPAQPQTKK